MITHDVLDEFRPNVGIILLNAEGKVWLGQRTPPKSGPPNPPRAWQLPQGGMDPGETPHQTAFRELFEETGVKSARLLTITPGWLAYEFPPAYVARKKDKWRGQKQKWAVMLFTGDDSEIDLDAHDEREFVDWRWATFEDITDSVISFKRSVYKELIESFRPLVDYIRGEGAAAWGWPNDLS